MGFGRFHALVVSVIAVTIAVAFFVTRSRRSARDASSPIRAEEHRANARDGGADAASDAAVDAAPQRDKRAVSHVAGQCAAIVADDDPSLFEEAIATAVFDDYDPASNHVTVIELDADYPSFSVIDCRGRKIAAHGLYDHVPGVVEVAANPILEPKALLQEAGLSGEIGARVVIGGEPGLCNNERGVIALLALRNRHVEVDALGELMGGCAGLSAPLTLVRFADTIAVLADNNDGGESGVSESRYDVYVRRGRELRLAGGIPSSFSQWRLFGGDGKPEITRAMTATLAWSPKGVTATETWTFVLTGADLKPVRGAKAKTQVIERRYWLEGDALVREPTADPITPE